MGISVPKFRVRRIPPKPEGAIHGSEADARSHNRRDFRASLQHPLGNEIVLRLAGDIEES